MAHPPSHNLGTPTNLPTPNLGGLPSVATAPTAAAPRLPLTTPPQTPMSVHVTGSGSTASVPSLGKRDSAVASESEQDVGDGQGAAKKRKIAPTVVSAGAGKLDEK